MLRFENLCKRFGTHVVFQGLHHASDAGCVMLNDESGTGKSTLLGILAGTIDADQGEVWIGGHSLSTSPANAKSALAYMPDDCMTYPLLTGRAFLEQVASARKTTVDARALDLAHRYGLEPHLDKRFEQMSLGTRKKVFLSAIALGAPSVVIAGEPDTGLDASSRAVLADQFKSLSDRCTVFFSGYDEALARACGARTVSFASLGARPESAR